MNMFDGKPQEHEEDEAFWDYLTEVFESLPKPAIQIIDPKRYREMMHAKQLLELAFDGEDEVDVELHELGSCGSLSVESDSLEVCKMSVFAKAALLADNFEMYPLVNGKIRFSMMFYGVLMPAAFQV